MEGADRRTRGVDVQIDHGGEVEIEASVREGRRDRPRPRRGRRRGPCTDRLFGCDRRKAVGGAEPRDDAAFLVCPDRDPTARSGASELADELPNLPGRRNVSGVAGELVAIEEDHATESALGECRPDPGSIAESHSAKADDEEPGDPL